jgi:uncharacterized protein YjbI with pentapeptide repeats
MGCPSRRILRIHLTPQTMRHARSTDVLFERCELREATFSTASLQRVGFRGWDLTGLRGAEALPQCANAME